MFPTIPADLSTLTDAELAALSVECVSAYQAARAEATTPEAVAALQGFAASFANVRGALEARAAAAAEAGTAAELSEADAEALAALDAAFSADAPADEAGAEAAPEADAEAEAAPETLSPAQIADLVQTAVTAAIGSAPARTRPRPAAQATIAELNARLAPEHDLLPAPGPVPFTITAAADVPNVPLGAQLTQRQLAEALIARSEQLGSGRGSADDRVPVASFSIDRGEARTLSSGDYAASNERKVREATEERESIVAAGGLCAPVNPFYEQRVISEAWRPVMGGPVVQMTVDRGGLQFNAPPSLSDITSGVGTITAAADLAGATGAVKACFAVTCPSITTVNVEADYVCVEFGNFGARTFPEQVEAWMALAAAAHARSAETNRLTDIKTASVAATAAGLVGAGREVLNRLEQVQAVINSAERRPSDAPVEVILPQWDLALMRADFTRTLTDIDQLGLADAEISAMFAARHLLVTLTPDSATGNGQVIAREAGGVINEYPTISYAEVFVPGTFIGLDSGRLDLGLVRDSALTMGSGGTPGNRFRMFYENFEAIAAVGPAGSRVELAMTLCADGTYGAAKAVTCPIVT